MWTGKTGLEAAAQGPSMRAGYQNFYGIPSRVNPFLQAAACAYQLTLRRFGPREMRLCRCVYDVSAPDSLRGRPSCAALYQGVPSCSTERLRRLSGSVARRLECVDCQRIFIVFASGPDTRAPRPSCPQQPRPPPVVPSRPQPSPAVPSRPQSSPAHLGVDVQCLL